MEHHQPYRTNIRAAVAADIPAIYDIWYANEVGNDSNPPPRGVPAVIEHELATGEIVVAVSRHA